MTSNATSTSTNSPNSPNAVDAALETPGFADVLLMSLSRAIPSGEARIGSGMPSDLLPASENIAKQLGNIAAESSGQIQDPQSAGTEPLLSSKKSVKRPDNAPSDSGVIGLALRGFYSSDSSNPVQQTLVSNSAFPNPTRKSWDISAYEHNSQSVWSERPQSRQGSTEDDPVTDRTLETLLARNGISEALSSSHASAVAADTSFSAQQSSPISSEPEKISVETEGLSSTSSDLSQVNLSNQLMATAARSGDVHASALPSARPLGQITTAPVFRFDSSAQGMPDPIVEGSDSARPRSATAPATSNVPPIAGQSAPTSAASNEDPNEKRTYTAPYGAIAGTTGSVPSQASPSPISLVAYTTLQPESSVQPMTQAAMPRRASDDAVPAQTQSATFPAFPAIFPATLNSSAIAKHSAPTSAGSSADPNSNWIGASKESSNGTLRQSSASTETNVASTVPAVPETSLGGAQFIARQPIQAPDPTSSESPSASRSSLSLTAISVESEDVVEAPTTPSSKIDAPTSIKVAILPDLFDSIEAKDPNLKTDRAPSSVDENSRKDAAKNPDDSIEIGATDAGAAGPATPLSDAVGGKAPKRASLPDLLDSAAIKDPSPSPKTDRAPSSADENSRKDAGKNPVAPIEIGATDAGAAGPAAPLSDAAIGKAPKRAILPDLLDSTETKDPNPKTDRAPSSADENSRKDAGEILSNPIANTATDVGAASPATPLSDAVNGKAPKRASFPDLLDSAAIKDSTPKTDRAPLSADENLREDAGKNLSDPDPSGATDVGAAVPATQLSDSVNVEAPEITSLSDALGSAAIEDPTQRADDAPLNAYEKSRKDAGKNPANPISDSAAYGGSATPQIPLSEPVDADSLKLGLAASANAAQAAGTDASSQTAGKPIAGDVKAPIHGADPFVKDGNRSEGADSSSGGGQQAASISSTQLTSQMNKSGVKIALQGEQFGAVELHAKVTNDQVSASITVDHHETHALLSSDLPALQQMLNERHLRVSEIILLHNSLASSGSSDGGPTAKREATTPQPANGSSVNGGGSATSSSASNGQTGADAIFDSRGRLSVRA
jgi:hypothetical protein